MTPQRDGATGLFRRRRPRRGFVERSVDALLDAMERSMQADRLASAGGLMQHVDPRAKVVGILALISAVALARKPGAVAMILAGSVLLALVSRLPLRDIAARAWGGTLVFTLALAVPALFLTPGRVIARGPAGLEMTETGARTAMMLVLRVETAVTLALILVISTPWARVLRALRVLHIPLVFVVILEMTNRFIHVLLQTAHEMFESRRSRRVGTLPAAEARRAMAWSGGVLLSKSLAISDEVYLAMQSRGFRGELRVLDEPRMRARDWAWLGAFAIATTAAVWWGR
jgi:cobalt ECF transporter T component CbiQ